MTSQVRIVNREKPFTSRKAAVGFVSRGIASWTDESRTAIYFREPEKVLQERGVITEMERDRMYWLDVARQRGGNEIQFMLTVRPSYPSGIRGIELRPVPKT